ncbi:GNAT family N-acetyltransferase [Polynucleobacter sp. AP-Ainpum-60-G11]|uniref:GNAT family N-acetyltransferase n=1 Tax=Polynucleobacter sp. AP-Ainpum-60-G11 TaxID=2576926 RepID=UPI001BFD8F42|nr:GNAT family N-acetyltransferase [Polynucleobacter sp. AP-Ainpum-60-G11]QWE25851.1 N-acetyltransferase [Polynucleobacter sp. AP-Ainpum-60-G11]
MKQDAIQLRVIQSLSEIGEDAWDALLTTDAGPFVKYAFLNALEKTACVGGNTGWQVAHLLVEDANSKLLGAIPLYLKQHSYGEFVFDWAWAQAYEQNNLPYYPKALSAIPFTPVRGPRLLVSPMADKGAIQELLVSGLKTLVTQNTLSSAHILFPEDGELEELKRQGFMLRDSVQFHWHNAGYQDFEHFLAALTMKRRKNIRRERAAVESQRVHYRHIPGAEATTGDWSFFYRCYENTYLEHRSSPYLTEECIQLLGSTMPENLHLIIATQEERPIASSLLVVDQLTKTAYGRYWGAIEHIPCLHFELAYYQTIEYCIKAGIQLFEGGAQGEHKMARGFLPTTLQSAHWIADAGFANAVKRFLEREHEGMAAYVDELEQHIPLKSTKVLP